MIRWYFAPIETDTFTGWGVGPLTASRCIRHVPLVTDDIGRQIPDPGVSVASIMPNPVKTWCLTRIESPDALIDTAIRLDPAITPTDLAGIPQDLSVVGAVGLTLAQTDLSARRIPNDWMTAATTGQEVLRYLCRVLMLTQMLKADYPDLPLTDRWGDLVSAQRTRIREWATNRNIDTADITVTPITPINTVLRRLHDRFPDWSRLPVRLGGETL